MADRIDQVAERLSQLITEGKVDLVTRLGVSDTADGPSAERTLSNTSLLLQSLGTFYRDANADFFPTIITTGIRDRLIQAESTFAGLPTADQPVPADVASNLLKQLEDLYAYCLQYGLMTYGFTGKGAQQQLELIRKAREQTEAAAQRLLTAVDRKESELTSKLDAFANSMVEAESGLKNTVTERLSAVEPLTVELAELLKAGQSNSTELANVLKAATENATAVGKVRADLDTAASAATAEFSARKTTADTELGIIQSLGKQVQGFESDAKANLKAVTDAKASITVQMTEITAFYAEIEAHRLQMTETGKAAQSHLAELRESAEKSVTELRKRTDQVVQTNESLIGQIKDHLRKAIGASLFTAFDRPRWGLSFASWVWVGLLLLSVGGTIWYSIWFVSQLDELGKANVHPALVYARLVIVAPLAFLVVFTAKQYSRERRAKEEYAFKAAVSVSLESYRDLIARMKAQGHDTIFVERLVAEIFDNPAKRLYAVPPSKTPEDERGVVELLKELLDKIPKAD